MADRDSLSNKNTNTQNKLVEENSVELKEEHKTDRVMEPILIEDFKNNVVPPSFLKVQQKLLQDGFQLDDTDYLVIIIHILMLESGFITYCEDYPAKFTGTFHYRRLMDMVDKLPSTFKKSNSHYELLYFIPLFNRKACRLTCLSVGDDFIVNCTFDNNDGTAYSILIDPLFYIIKSAVELQNKFQNMAHLSYTIKSAISNPVKTIILNENRIKAFCLLDMPPEVLLNIMKYFNAKNLAAFELTCQYFREISNCSSVWTKIQEPESSKYDSFKSYKAAENAKLKITRIMRSVSRQHFMI